MIALTSLENLAFLRLRDAKILYNQKHYISAFYLVWYCVELSLKFKICKIFRFDDWFPENKAEFTKYVSKSQSTELDLEIKNIWNIKHHNLAKLVYYSWVEFQIKRDFLEEWENILYWNPELRYKENIEFDNESNIIVWVEKMLNFIFK